MQSLRLTAAGLPEAADYHKLAGQNTEIQRMRPALIPKRIAES